MPFCYCIFLASTSDPSLLMVPPTNGFSNNFYILSCNPSFSTHYLNIVIDSSTASCLLLNGQSFLDSATAHTIPGTTLSAYQYQLSCGGVAASFFISHPTSVFGVAAYGYGLAISYAYMAGVRFGQG